MTLKRECNACTPALDTINNAYHYASTDLKQRKQDEFLGQQQKSGCTTERICLPGAQLRAKTTDLLQPGWNSLDDTLLIRSAGSLK